MDSINYVYWFINISKVRGLGTPYCFCLFDTRGQSPVIRACVYWPVWITPLTGNIFLILAVLSQFRNMLIKLTGISAQLRLSLIYYYYYWLPSFDPARIYTGYYFGDRQPVQGMTGLCCGCDLADRPMY